jgi:hypothetical protein
VRRRDGARELGRLGVEVGPQLRDAGEEALGRLGRGSCVFDEPPSAVIVRLEYAQAVAREVSSSSQARTRSSSRLAARSSAAACGSSSRTDHHAARACTATKVGVRVRRGRRLADALGVPGEVPEG